MKLFKKNNIVFFLIIVLITACTSEFEEINTNPNSQEEGSNEGLLLGAQIGAASVLLDNVRGYNSGLGKWVQYYNTNLTPTDFVKSNPREDFNDFWVYHNLTTSVIPLIERVIDNSEKVPNANYNAVALIMKAWVYSSMTELWGPIPYFDAQYGEDSEELQYNKPKFDSQKEILLDALELLKKANEAIIISNEAGVAINSESDAYASGDLLKWKKFSNSLRARILLRISDVEPAFASSELSELFLNPTKFPVMTSNDDNFGISWEDAEGSFPDPFARYKQDNSYGPFLISGFVNLLGEKEDPRLKYLADPAEGYDQESYIGLPPAFDDENPFGFTRMSRDSVSQISYRYMEVQKRNIMTFSELNFIKAEASFKGIDVGISPEDAYYKGIMSNMWQLSIPDDLIKDYVDNIDVVFNNNNAMELIITQRYIAQFGQSINSFSMIRRTGLPLLDYFAIGVNKENGFPVRVGYPSGNMQNFNNENFEEAVEGVNIVNKVFGDNLWFSSNSKTPEMTPFIQQGPKVFSY
ncbi:SusD/RagB family nutrient-binding outer membrane lipoprotein [Joostella atrarenae]|uniref:SusD/RagB family nutrient-binding outer membrane lipoprotein n=1 Tax=Joostella atrarenae TaxID=679257 RepID=A0ABS9J548_9FLAO|nr:SusD/RagB family nutrient-binding outer membrane lipoprotein [Joostella atrarenae]MCF8715519.1 SusD/RagB family nutrient-binding outer membrane lipoprotein [Joostella atrarenae]